MINDAERLKEMAQQSLFATSLVVTFFNSGLLPPGLGYYLSCCVNPLVYCAMSYQYRRALAAGLSSKCMSGERVGAGASPRTWTRRATTARESARGGVRLAASTKAGGKGKVT